MSDVPRLQPQVTLITPCRISTGAQHENTLTESSRVFPVVRTCVRTTHRCTSTFQATSRFSP
ncbi:hypothetical protein, partial [Escherichia coli]|uniref:hypothetical protein n=2 Tax=Escherichia coli TaxID=562 RepID=UPI00193AE80B